MLQSLFSFSMWLYLLEQFFQMHHYELEAESWTLGPQ